MKKLLTLTFVCLLFCSVLSFAQANGWGLKGGIYDIVSEDERYKLYTAIADSGNSRSQDGSFHVNHAILQNRYHAVLISAVRKDKVWQTSQLSTTAVYQPGDKRGEYPNQPTLACVDGQLILSYGDQEVYTFHYSDTDGKYHLTDVRYQEDKDYVDCFVLEDDGLGFWQSNPDNAFLPIGDAHWETDGITLEEFNISQMPRTLSEVRRVNMTTIALMEFPVLAATGTWQGEKEAGKLAVYSAPDAASYRSVSGKASVSLGGDVQIFGTAAGWTLIQYEVSTRTSRIGYVQQELGGEALTLASVPLTAAVNTFLTDDPFVSQYAQADIPAGAALTGLAKCGEYYAYVEYQADELYRGFVPLKDLMPTYDRALTTGDDLLTADVLWDVMDALCGKWYPKGGSWKDQLILFSNGSFSRRVDFEYTGETGNYRVYDAGEGVYELYCCTESNEESRYILLLNEDETITLKTDVGETVLCRDECSTYGNG